MRSLTISPFPADVQGYDDGDVSADEAILEAVPRIVAQTLAWAAVEMHERARAIPYGTGRNHEARELHHAGFALKRASNEILHEGRVSQ